ncbi:MAG: hypothetical protein BWY77_00705 [bacterium ADurb.Bin431]|nr:MAG: hypothetical protein BWY77_00705 [bacterium ADurb.Bin431]
MITCLLPCGMVQTVLPSVTMSWSPVSILNWTPLRVQILPSKTWRSPASSQLKVWVKSAQTLFMAS